MKDQCQGLSDAVEWLRRQGHRLLQTDSSYWYDAAPGIYQAFPYHLLIEPSEAELAKLFRGGRVLAARYSTPLTGPAGHISYHVILRCVDFSEQQVPKKARYDVRRGRAYATIERIGFDRLAAEGWRLRRETLARQNRPGAESESWWIRLCLSADGLPALEAWGAIHRGALVAGLIGCRIGDHYCILYQQSLTEHLQYAVNNALAFVATQHAFCRPGIRTVFYGLNSLDAPDSVDQFKFRMGFVAEPVRQRVVFHSVARPFCNSLSLALTKQLARTGLHPALGKMEGMLRFYVEGQQPLENQRWPEALSAAEVQRRRPDQ